MTRHQTGFTLLELIVALALTAMVATAAIATLNAFVEADSSATRRMEQATGASRALLVLQRDVVDARVLEVQADYVVLTRHDDTFVAYAIARGGSELHRFADTDPAVVRSQANAALSATGAAPAWSARGHLRDADYRATAVLQGAGRLRFTAFAPGGTAIGATLELEWLDGSTSRCVAVSSSLAEGQSKAAAITAASGSTGSTGSTGSETGVGAAVTGIGNQLNGLLNGNSKK